jgi:hypothetical protein
MPPAKRSTAKKTTAKPKKIRVVFETTEKGLAQQVAKAIRAAGRTAPRKPTGMKPRAGGWSQNGGWLLDNGPSGPWGQQGGWTQGKDRVKPKQGTKVKPAGKKKNVRGAVRRTRPR